MNRLYFEFISNPAITNDVAADVTRKDIRALRKNTEGGYKDVSSFIDYLKNYKNSAEAQLLMLNGFVDDNGDLDVDQVRDMLFNQGIRGNLGRRDSGRLANVLNTLKAQSTSGTEGHRQFLKAAVNLFNNNDLYRTRFAPEGRMFKKLKYTENPSFELLGGTNSNANYGITTEDDSGDEWLSSPRVTINNEEVTGSYDTLRKGLDRNYQNLNWLRDQENNTRHWYLNPNSKFKLDLKVDFLSDLR